MGQPTTRSRAPQAPSTIPFPKQAVPKINFPFIVLADAIAADPDLCASAKILLSVVASLARREKCTAGNEYLASRTGLSVIQVRRLLARLEGRGLIARKLSGKTRLEIRITAACINLIHGNDQPDTSPCITVRSAHVSGGCTELDSGEKDREDSGFSPPEEEIDPQTARWFGHLLAPAGPVQSDESIVDIARRT